MKLNLTSAAPTTQTGLTEGGFYSVLIKTLNNAGTVIIEAEVDTGDWKSIGELAGGGFISVSALPGTSLRFTLVGVATGKARITKAA